MKLRRVLAFAVVFVLLGSVGFGESKRRTEFFTYTLGPVEEVLTACPAGFNIVNRLFIHSRVLARVDQDGMPVQEIWHNTFSDSIFYNDADPMYWLEGSEKPQTDRVVFEDNKVYISGHAFKVVVPGEGVVAQTVGRWTFNMLTGEWEDWHGPDDYFVANWDALCRALTP